MSTQISVRFEDKDAKRLFKLAKEARRPLAQILRQYIHDHMEDIEDIYISLARLESGETFRPLADVLKELEIREEELV